MAFESFKKSFMGRKAPGAAGGVAGAAGAAPGVAAAGGVAVGAGGVCACAADNTKSPIQAVDKAERLKVV